MSSSQIVKNNGKHPEEYHMFRMTHVDKKVVPLYPKTKAIMVSTNGFALHTTQVHRIQYIQSSTCTWLQEHIEEKVVELEVEENGPVYKDALYEGVHNPEKHRTCVSKIARMMESQQLKQPREEVTLAIYKTTEVRKLVEESTNKVQETRATLCSFRRV